MKNTIRRRALIVGVVGALALGTAACNRGPEASQGNGEGNHKIALAISTLNNPFFIQLRDGAQEAAKELGVTLEVTDAQDDASTQQNQLANAATQGVDAVIINPVDSEAAGAAVTPVLEAKIPVIAVDRSVEGKEVDSTVSSDNVAGGKQAAEALAKAIGEKGNVIVLQGVAGTSASRDRGAGFQEGIKQFPNIKVVAMQPANFARAQGLDVATNLLQSNPDAVGIFAENDEMALGAIQALGARAGKDVFVVGFDGTEDGLKAISDGTLSATIAQQPAELGKEAVKAAVAKLKGESIDKDIPVEVKTVDSSNVSEFSK